MWRAGLETVRYFCRLPLNVILFRQFFILRTHRTGRLKALPFVVPWLCYTSIDITGTGTVYMGKRISSATVVVPAFEDIVPVSYEERFVFRLHVVAGVCALSACVRESIERKIRLCVLCRIILVSTC